MDNYRIIKGEGVAAQLEAYLADEAAAGRSPVLIKYFISDAQNQLAALKVELTGCGKGLRTGNARTGLPLWDTAVPFARRGEERNGVVSVVEQPPLDGSRIAALVWTSSDADKYMFDSIRLTEDEAAGKDPYEQTRLLFAKYLAIIKPLGLELKTHCVRTWVYVRDIDNNYAGMVRARNDVFDEEGLTDHSIASTGIGGATDVPSALVAIDFLTCPGIREEDKAYLEALSHLNPTREYGVMFERGVRLSDGHIFISGTASIDNKGRIVHEGDVLAQTGRLLENIAALLSDCPGRNGCEGVIRSDNAGTGLPLWDTDLPFVRRGRHTVLAVPYLLIYLRNDSDFAKVDAYMQERYPDIQRIILKAPVCRPGWLIEMECQTNIDYE